MNDTPRIIVVPEGAELEAARAIAAPWSDATEWGCPTCGSRHITVRAAKEQMFRVPLTGLWRSETHGHHAYLDWSDPKSAGTGMTFYELLCEECGWTSDSKGDTAALWKAP